MKGSARQLPLTNDRPCVVDSRGNRKSGPRRVDGHKGTIRISQVSVHNTCAVLEATDILSETVDVSRNGVHRTWRVKSLKGIVKDAGPGLCAHGYVLWVAARRKRSRHRVRGGIDH